MKGFLALICRRLMTETQLRLTNDVNTDFCEKETTSRATGCRAEV
jgi:hypothetical protein